jgi:hypothetical protein
MKKPISLDVILPTTLDLTPEEILVERCDIGKEGYSENIEYCLQLSFSNSSSHDEPTINIDYCGDDYNLLSDFFEFDTDCNLNTFIQKQYEIANLLGIKTRDM